MEYTIDCANVSSKEEFHRILAETLHFPAHYGRNLDALYDCLTDIGEDTCVGFFEPEEENEIRPYLQRVKRVLRDAENENLHLAVVFCTPEDNLPEGDEGDVDL